MSKVRLENATEMKLKLTVSKFFELSDFGNKNADLRFQYPLFEKQHSRFSSTQVIVAALNEEAGIGLTITELKDNLDSPHIIVVDGHSRDRTAEIAKNLGVDVAFQDGIGRQPAK